MRASIHFIQIYETNLYSITYYSHYLQLFSMVSIYNRLELYMFYIYAATLQRCKMMVVVVTLGNVTVGE